MNFRTVRVVLRKELRETLRDRRTLFLMLVIPTLLYPTLFVVLEQLALFGQRSLRQQAPVVAVAGGDDVRAFLVGDTLLRVVAATGANAGSVRDGKTDAAVIAGPEVGAESTREVRVLFDESSDRSRRAHDLVRARLAAWDDTLLSRRLAARGLPAGFAAPLEVRDSSVATAQEAGGYALGRFLPGILVMMTLLGAFYPAIDLAAGEKERGTLETLLTAPVPSREIVMGKFLTVALLGVAAAMINLLSMLLTFQSGLFRFGQAANLSFSLPWGAALLVTAGLVPLAVLFAALFLGIAVRSQSFKEAQNALTPVQFAVIVPVMLISLPGIQFTPLLAAVPVAGVALLFRDLMSGTARLVPTLVAFGTSAVYAAIALAFAARAFGREDVLFGGGASNAARGGWVERARAWRSRSQRIPLPAAGLAFIAVIALLYFHLGAAIQGRLGERGIMVSQLLLLAVPAVAFATLGPYDARRTLALRRPSGRTLAAALLIALGGIPLGWMIGWLQLSFFPDAAEALRELEKLVTATDGARALWLLLLVAVTPAICEELVFRGVLLQSMGREVPVWRAVGMAALIFGIFHLSNETAIRFLPTAWIGLLMGYVVWHGRSIFASMLMHFVTNGTVVLLLWQPSLRSLVLAEDRPTIPVMLAGPLLLGLGLWLLPRRTGRAADELAAAPAV
ncbi:MAG TPA: ABC transporter permease subunit/CPBP intramembrane protease [Longimicrobium sp.]|nr:ABC transporter permease subunit/CPBP intramembrane protease [Longimicrobium sp.]